MMKKLAFYAFPDLKILFWLWNGITILGFLVFVKGKRLKLWEQSKLILRTLTWFNFPQDFFNWMNLILTTSQKKISAYKVLFLLSDKTKQKKDWYVFRLQNYNGQAQSSLFSRSYVSCRTKEKTGKRYSFQNTKLFCYFERFVAAASWAWKLWEQSESDKNFEPLELLNYRNWI